MVFDSVSNIAVQGYLADGTIKYWNRASERLYGYTAAEAIGHDLVELIIPPEMRDGVRAAIRHGAQTGEMPPPAELALLHKNGSRINVMRWSPSLGRNRSCSASMWMSPNGRAWSRRSGNRNNASARCSNTIGRSCC